ncbi:UTP--glucose-1-phosphate uridylyltransferase GalU [Vitiosangium sp. GDMCC 1.1324]|uniref:UTP--glucose-1-phosphate uridylyltransferase GalU n=1 Tax=Vitiosangium sp. (strain GDMCC 1.1324) TaxID=2138576 RepID=UPI000D34ACCA|nr:UTP--glucose-1-phosphate uridylyltransferase GalU [Vitiosangium sp. GDMCC 1.1324]PTL79052.1 UTP--glucose-1-phosphate uridylyltransferase [Vitiosangium sp. GDMCC 1.1324]
MSTPSTTKEPLIRKCVVPAAGLGTRFLPATKAIPKEMLPIVDTPTLQYIVEEAVSAGIEDVILISGRGKESMVDHFDLAVELEAVLKARGKDEEFRKLRAISELANIVSVRQKEPLGLGHAVLCARDVVGHEPFGVILGDDIIDSDDPGIRQLARVYRQHGLAVVALMEVPEEETHMYGVAAGTDIGDGVIRIDRIVEKPKKGTAPSNLAVIGRYVLPPEIFGILETQQPGAGGEIQLTDGLATLQKTKGLLGYKFKGKRYDAGDKLGYLKANIAFAMKRPELRDSLLAWMAEVVRTGQP